MESEIPGIPLAPGCLPEISALCPAAAARRAADAAAHPACPSHGVLTLLLGYALARAALPGGGAGGGGDGARPESAPGAARDEAAAADARGAKRAAFLDTLHRW
jgi:hypothetical protein